MRESSFFPTYLVEHVVLVIVLLVEDQFHVETRGFNVDAFKFTRLERTAFIRVEC